MSASPEFSPAATVGDAVRDAAARLKAGSPTARLDAELLMAFALGVSREALLLTQLDHPVPSSFAPLLARRLTDEPIAYITGCRDFWSINLTVAPGVLIPRPDSETLVEAAVAHFGRAGPGRVLDLGTGSGALLLAALAQWPLATGLGIDTSAVALEIAAGNADRLGVADRAHFSRGNWGEGIGECFDLVLCNPPYVESTADLPAGVVKYEPASALFAGSEGLDDYRRIFPQLPALIAPGGIACVEIGYTQADPVSKLAAQAGLNVELKRDLAGRPRCLVLSACVDA